VSAQLPVREELEDGRGKYYTYTVLARVQLAVASNRGEVVDEITVFGTASSRDNQFNNKPLEDIDVNWVKQSAISDAFRLAVVRMLGLRGVPVGELEELGVEVDKIPNVEFQQGRKKRAGGTAAIAAPAQKPTGTPPPPAQAHANGGNGLPEGCRTWVEAFKKLVQAQVGDHTSEAGRRLLRQATAYDYTTKDGDRKTFDGFMSWERLETREKAEVTARISYKRLREIIAAQAPPAAMEDEVPEEPGQAELFPGAGE
jgi:hypothetical protein